MIYASSASVFLDDETNPFMDMLDKILNITNYQWKIQVQVIVLFKIINHLPRRVISNILQWNNFNLINL